MVCLFAMLPFDDEVGGCDVDDVDTVLVTAFVDVDTVCFVEPVDTTDEEGNVTARDCVNWIGDTGGVDDGGDAWVDSDADVSGDTKASDNGGCNADEVVDGGGCGDDFDCVSDDSGDDCGDDWFDANDDIDCDSCSDDDDPDATSVGDSDADGDSGGPVDDGASCVDCDCGKSDFDDGDGDVDVNADGSGDDVSSVDAAKGDVVADPDG